MYTTDTSDFYKNVGNQIKYIRKANGVSRITLSSAVGISAKFLYEIENGKKGFSVDILYRIIHSLNVSFDKIIG